MSNINEYYAEVRSDIAKDFGLESAGYAPRSKSYLTIREAQRLNNKYPAIGTTRYDMVVNPKALVIIKRLKAIRIANNWKGAN